MKSKTPTLGGPPSRPGTPGPFRAQVPPYRAQTPPPQALDANKFQSEPPTKQKNMTASIYQSLLSVFDEMKALLQAMIGSDRE